MVEKPMDIVRDGKTLTEAIRGLKRQGKAIGLVPTMGALHAGHVSLVRLAQEHADAVVASVFVNPAQFGPNEDFSRYPRTEAQDLAALSTAGAVLAYLPTVEEMYGQGAQTQVDPGPIATQLCGAFRPGHFRGVATVVAKLFLRCAPDVAVFGEKDYQQLHILRCMARDLDFPVRVLGAPILREEDGLALSSRNRYLAAGERAAAPAMYRILTETASRLRAGETKSTALADARAQLLACGFNHVDYVELRDARTLAPLNAPNVSARLLGAANLGATRLIDNVAV